MSTPTECALLNRVGRPRIFSLSRRVESHSTVVTELFIVNGICISSQPVHLMKAIMNVKSMHFEQRRKYKTKFNSVGPSARPALRTRYQVPAEHAVLWLLALAGPSVHAQAAVEPVEAAASAPDAAASAPDAAASAPEKAQFELQKVEVKGSRGRVKHSNIATKLDVENRDVPASVQVISPETLKEQSKSQAINDVLRNVSGVSQNYGTSSGNQPNIMLRGFETGGVVLQDGYARAGGNGYDWSGIQQIEVLKGPSSVLYGQQTNIGGQINILTKKPVSAPLAEMELSIGRWGYQRATVDLGGPLNESRSLTYRLNLATESSDSFRDHLFEKKLFAAPSVRWDIGPDDSLLLSGEVSDRKYRLDPGLPAPSDTAWLGREYWYPGLPRDKLGYALPINTYIGLASWDTSHDRVGALVMEWEHEINERWHLKVGSMRDQNHLYWRDSSFLWFQPTDDAGQPNGPVENLLTARVNGTRFRTNQVSVDVTGEFETKGVKHKLLVGLGSIGGSVGSSGPAENKFLLAEGPLGDDAWRLPGANYTLVPDPSITRAEWGSSQRQKGLYAQDMIEFLDHWKALIGYRYTIATGNSFLYVNDDTTTDSFTYTGGTPRLGLVWQPSQTLSLYGGWSTSFTPNWGRLSGGGLPPPEKGRQQEIGLKKEFAGGKASLNIAAYRIDKTNVERCAPDSPDCRLYVLVGSQRSQGLEFDLNGEIRPNLRLSMAMTLQDAKVIQDLPVDQGGLPVGSKLTGAPRWVFNIFSSYMIKEGRFAGLTIGGGLNRSADSEGNLPNDAYRIAGTKRLDLMAEYSITPNTKVQLNINNVTDQINYATPGTGMLTFANKPREAVLTLTARR